MRARPIIQLFWIVGEVSGMGWKCFFIWLYKGVHHRGGKNLGLNAISGMGLFEPHSGANQPSHATKTKRFFSGLLACKIPQLRFSCLSY